MSSFQAFRCFESEGTIRVEMYCIKYDVRVIFFSLLVSYWRLTVGFWFLVSCFGFLFLVINFLEHGGREGLRDIYYDIYTFT